MDKNVRITKAEPAPPRNCIPFIIGLVVWTVQVEKTPPATATKIPPKNSQGLKWPNLVTVVQLVH
jgi:hypothetical protein